MEQMESLQRVNRQQRLVEWSRRVEACRGSGLTVVQWCQEHGIAVSTYFSWQRKVFQALTEAQEITFAEVPVLEYSQPSGHVQRLWKSTAYRSRSTRERIRTHCRHSSRR